MLIILLVMTLLMALVIWFDATRYLIPNWLVGLVLAAWPIMLMLTPESIEWKYALLVGLATFAMGYIIFILRWMGGGDVKLLAACALWTGTSQFLPFIFLTALLGGALTVVLLIIRALIPKWMPEKSQETLPRIAQSGAPAPYGLAIAGAFLTMLWQQLLPGVVWVSN